MYVKLIIVGLVCCAVVQGAPAPDKSIQERAQEAFDRMKEKAQEALDYAQDAASKAIDSAKSKVQEVMGTAEEATKTQFDKGEEFLVEQAEQLAAKIPSVSSQN